MVADHFADDIDDKMHRIAASGGLGASRETLGPGLRMSTFKGRNIYFRVTDSECRIVRVIHASRDLADQSFTDPDDAADT